MAVTAIVVTETLYGEAASKAVPVAKFVCTGITSYNQLGDDFDLDDYMPPGYTLLGVVNCTGDSAAPNYYAVYNATLKKIHWYVKTTGVECAGAVNLTAETLSFLVFTG